MNLAKSVATIRKNLQMNQRDFAAAIGITQTALSQIETGTKIPSNDTLTSIASYCNTSVDVIKMAGLEVENDIPEDKQALFNELFPNFAERLAGMITGNADK